MRLVAFQGPRKGGETWVPGRLTLRSPTRYDKKAAGTAERIEDITGSSPPAPLPRGDA